MITTTGWLEGKEIPIHAGVYQTSRKSVKGIGWGYAEWRDGCWRPYGRWGNHYQMFDFIWRGLSGKTRSEEFAVAD